MEGPTTTPEPPPPAPERAPASYEQALDAARAMKAAGIEDPYDEESLDARGQEALDTVNTWRHDRGLHMSGMENAEKAADVVRSATLWLEAGYDSTDALKSALENLHDEHDIALRGGDPQAIGILREAMDAVERRLGARDPKEKMPAILAAKITEANELVEQGKIKSAIGTLTLALLDQRFKKFPADVMDKVREMRDALKERQ